MIIVEIKDLTKYYETEGQTVKAIDGISLAVKKGTFTTITGASGSGKSTLLNIMGGLDYPTSGTVKVDGAELANLSAEELAIFRRRKTGFIFQNYNLLPLLSVYENIIFPLQLDNSPIDQDYVDKIIRYLKLEDKVTHSPQKLSGGQQQRVAIARALISKPAIILADEPTGNLDTRSSQEVMGLLRSTCDTFSQTLIMITHNPEIAQLADTIYQIEDGKIV